MGNDKANNYWEVELPPDYDRVGIENFILLKSMLYILTGMRKRDGFLEMKNPNHHLEDGMKGLLHVGRDLWKKSGHGHISNSENSFDERRTIQASSRKENLPATRVSLPVPPKGPDQVTPMQKPEPVVAPAEATKLYVETAPVVMPPKFDYATDLFNMLSMDDGPSENGSGEASTDDNNWAGFQSAGKASTTEKTDPPKAAE